MRGQNAEGAEVAQRTQKNTENIVWIFLASFAEFLRSFLAQDVDSRLRGNDVV